MLMLRPAGPELAVHRRLDEYFPLQIDFSPAPSSLDELFYWRCTGEDQLLEVAIAASTGVVAGIELVKVPLQRSRIMRSPALPASPVDLQGAPVFDLGPWKRRIGPREFGVDPALHRLDEELPYAVDIFDDGLRISWGGGSEDTSLLNGEVRFGFGRSGSLISIAVLNLTAAELALFRSAAHLG